MADKNRALDELSRRARLPELIGRSTWAGVRKSFADTDFDRWSDALDKLIVAGTGTAGLIDFAAASVEAARLFGPDAGLAVAPAALAIQKQSGGSAATAFLTAIPAACRHIKDAAAFRHWLETMEQLAQLAPESVAPLIEKLDFILVRIDSAGFRNWMLAGIRSASGDAAQRQAYFSLWDESALRAFEQASSDVLFVDVERRLKAYLTALWGLRPAMRTMAVRPGRPAPRRAAFDGLITRVPEAFAGLHGQEAVTHYRAVLSHIGAHQVYSGPRMPVGTLKPVQIALISLIEDARVEMLASRDYPGLRRLWTRYHTARPQTALTAEILMPRLARALIDPEYKDDDPFVNKGKMMFFDHRSQWSDPSISRRIGGLLGNDLGQMRIQFNPKTYIVQPSYRDDNNGLWDFGEPPPEEAETAETILDSVRIEQREEKDKRQKDEQSEGAPPANQAARLQAVGDDVGVPIARYAEWDYIAGSERAEWTTVVEFPAKPAPADAARALTEAHSALAARIARLVKNAKISRPERLRRQAQGDRLDLDACIRTAIDRRTGVQPDPRVYETTVMRARDLSVLVLLDISESTRDRIRDQTTTVIQVERIATALLSEAMDGLGDPFAVHAFCSDGREDVRLYRVKDFEQRYDDGAKARLAGLRGGLSTRLGAALRHAGAEIEERQTHRRLVLVITDGEPSDVDITDKRYLVEDARRAVHDLGHRGIDVFCVGLDSGGENYLPRIFGRRGYITIDRVEALPEKLPMLYFRMTA
ncbi:MAG: VWA domain-containing protein [Rhizobiaceae bacterium]|nr:VWA domain-containing protein [Rhizobiaceae bacterium]